jgi:hypothetical protein
LMFSGLLDMKNVVLNIFTTWNFWNSSISQYPRRKTDLDPKVFAAAAFEKFHFILRRYL